MQGILITLIGVAALANAGTLTHRPNGCPIDTNVHAQFTHNNCNQFYICTFGVRVPQVCPDGLHYNAELQLCDWAVNVDCGDRLVPVTIGKPNPVDVICSDAQSERLLVAHEYCHKFYNCINQEPFIHECPAGLYYNVELEVCDWAMNVDCSTRIKV